MRTKWYSSLSLLITLIITCTLFGCRVKQEGVIQEPATPNTTIEETPMNYIATFQFAKPERISLEYYKKMSDQRDSIPAQTKKEITDAAKIDEFMTMTSALADKGDMMVKMGDVPITNVILHYPNEKLYFTFYQNRVKTPDTSFYSNSPENEKVLYDFLFSLLNK